MKNRQAKSVILKSLVAILALGAVACNNGSSGGGGGGSSSPTIIGVTSNSPTPQTNTTALYNSSNGSTWTAESLPTFSPTALTLPLTGIAYSHESGSFVAVTANAQSIYSTNNGASWTLGTTGTNTPNAANPALIAGIGGTTGTAPIFIGANAAVSVTTGVNIVSWSANSGNTWTQATIGNFIVNPSVVNKLAYGGRVFVATNGATLTSPAQESNFISYSFNGESWFTPSFVGVTAGGSFGNLQATPIVARGTLNNKPTFIVVTKQTTLAESTQIYLSQESGSQLAGVLWNAPESGVFNNSTAAASIIDVAGGPGVFVAISANQAYTSTNGINWSLVALPSTIPPGTLTLTGIKYVAGRFMAFGTSSNGGITQNVIYQSTPGNPSVWTEAYSLTAATTNFVPAIVSVAANQY